MIVSIISIILLVIFSFILLSIFKKEKIKLEKRLEEEKKEKYEEYVKSKIKETASRIDTEITIYRCDILEQYDNWKKGIQQERQNIERSLEERKQAVEEIIEQLESRRREAEKNYNDIITNEKEKINKELEFYQKNKIDGIESKLQFEFAEKTAAANKAHEELVASLMEQKKQKEYELAVLLEEIDDFKKKQTVINEEILRRRQVEEQQEFFKIALDENSIRDIQILLSIREKLISRENLDKLIYDVYISKPVMEMIKRVLAGGAPSGIYKITRLKTGEIYIGKSTDVKKRWTEHCKTAFGVGSIAHSILHTTMKKDGIENFTFELLEEVPKDKLTEREKYWITFYDSKNYGLNMREG